MLKKEKKKVCYSAKELGACAIKFFFNNNFVDIIYLESKKKKRLFYTKDVFKCRTVEKDFK